MKDTTPTSSPTGWDACSKNDTLFILICTVLCWPIIPAVNLPSPSSGPLPN